MQELAPRVVITSVGSYGDLYPYLGLALGLRARGYDPLLAVPGVYREDVEREGLRFAPVRPDIDPADRRLLRRAMESRTGTRFLVKRWLGGCIRESYADVAAAARGADLLVTHTMSFAGPLVAERLGLLWASTVLAPISFLSARDLPVLPPAPWSKQLASVPGAGRLLVAVARAVTRGWTSPVRALRRELGLPPGGHPMFEGQHSPHLVLALFSRVLGRPQPDWPPHVRVTGSIPYNGPATGRPLSPRLEAFLAAGPPPVVVTLGTAAVFSAGRFYHETVEAVRRLGVRAVLLTGPLEENRPPGPLPPGVLLEEGAPHATLFPRASAIVHQGGAGTLHQALRAGRPMLVVPFAHDQPDNAWRAERLGVSRTVPAGRYRATRVERELRALLERRRYRERAEEVAEKVRAEDGVKSACDAIDELLAVRQAGRRPPQKEGRHSNHCLPPPV